MGNKKSVPDAEQSQGSEPTPTIIRTMTKAYSATSQNGEKTQENTKRTLKESAEKELCDAALKCKEGILYTNIRSKALSKMSVDGKKSAWEELEKLSADDSITIIDLSRKDLSNSKVFERLCNSLINKKSLQELLLSDCRLTMIPTNLPENLKKIDLKENLITVIRMPLPPDITYLDLSYNKISEVPPGLGGKISFLDLHNNRISKITNETFADINSLHFLNLSGNQISEMLLSISIPCLNTLNLSFNKIVNIPKEFFVPSNSLMNLNLSNNPLVYLHPIIGNMESLTKLDLRATKIKELPSTLIKIKNLEHLFLDKVCLDYPPMYIVNKGFEAIMQYLRDYPIDYPKNLTNPKEESICSDDKSDNQANNFAMPMIPSLTLGISTSYTPTKKSTKSLRTLDKGVFLNTKNWIDSKLYRDEDDILKELFEKLLENEERDTDKVILTIHAIKGVLEEYTKEYVAGSRVIEVPASSSYFIGRIGGYSEAVVFLRDLGFELSSKPFMGLVFSIKPTSKKFKQVKQFIGLTEEFIAVLKNCRIAEQFVPDYELNKQDQ